MNVKVWYAENSENTAFGVESIASETSFEKNEPFATNKSTPTFTKMENYI